MDTEERVGPYTVRIQYDEWAGEGPMDDPETSACVITAHRQYDSTNVELADYGMSRYHGELYIGDEPVRSWDDVTTHLRRTYGAEVMLIRMYDHSGISLSANPQPQEYWFHDQWDSGTYGVVFATRDMIAEWHGSKRVTKRMREKAREYMAAMIKSLGAYMNGEVYWVEIVDPSGEAVDRCGGLIGYDDAIASGREFAELFILHDIVRPRTYMGDVHEGIPAVTGSNGATFDQQIIRFDDGSGRTAAMVRIIRDRTTRPKWFAVTESTDRVDKRVLVSKGTLEACQEAARRYFVEVVVGTAPDALGRTGVYNVGMEEVA